MAREITDSEVRAESGADGTGEQKRAPRSRKTLSSVLGFFNFIVFTAACVAGVLVYLPAGATPGVEGGRVTDIEAQLRETVDENHESLTLDEQTVNDYLAETLVAEDPGSMGKLVRNGRVWLRFRDGGATIWMERSAFGWRSTIEVDVKVETGQKSHTLAVEGCRFGQLPVAAGFVRMVLPALRGLGDAYAKDLEVLVTAKKITFANGKMILSY